MKLRTRDGRVVGDLDGNVAIIKKSEKKHKLMSPEAWCFDTELLDSFVENGATTIRVETTDTGKKFLVSVEFFVDKAFKLDRGYNKQLGLPIVYWDTGEPAEQLSLL